jgi:hypothetical protein
MKMNKRQAKKNRTAYKRMEAKDKGVVYVNLKDVSPNRQIDVYISKKFEATEGRRIVNELQNKGMTCDPKKLKNFTHLLVVEGGGPKPFGLTVWLSDTDKSYYVIRPKREPEEGETVTDIEAEEVITL